VTLPTRDLAELDRFVAESGFASRGAVFTDIDGTAVHEHEGRLAIPSVVEYGLKRLYDAGRPVVLNSLRFPLSVIRSFGSEWYRISGTPIPTIALNGSQIGRVMPDASGQLSFEELEAFPLRPAEIEEMLRGVRGLVANGVDELLVFYYPRDWRAGEQIWTPSSQRVEGIAAKYRSASTVLATPLDALEAALLAEPVCMIFLLIDLPEDRLMAYQHTKRTSFFTHEGVDKLRGAEEMARVLGVALEDCVGAGDSELDTFLRGVGLAVIVGNSDLDFRGRHTTLRVSSSLELGELLFRLAGA
jgi:hydroxymethylpyrimidine pyrophosphatase-like HAD family hydrolase